MEKKVFISGCYDLLHSGHVAFFMEAATYGDLFVGIDLFKKHNSLTFFYLLLNPDNHIKLNYYD